jgi:hypothetical protein
LDSQRARRLGVAQPGDEIAPGGIGGIGSTAHPEPSPQCESAEREQDVAAVQAELAHGIPQLRPG